METPHVKHEYFAPSCLPLQKVMLGNNLQNNLVWVSNILWRFKSMRK